MFLYWTMFAVPALSGLAPARAGRAIRQYLVVGASVCLIIIIGMRYQVGCDWFQYLSMHEDLAYYGLRDALASTDAGYALVDWISLQLGTGVYLTNIVCGTIFVSGLMAFCMRQPLPWLALVVAIPYCVVVVGMGYTRQAAALGAIMLAFNAFTDEKLNRFLLFVFLGALFHKTAIVFGLLAVVLKRKHRLSGLVIGLLATAGGFSLLLLGTLEYFVAGYVEHEYNSDGGLYRLAINVVGAVIVFVFYRVWQRQFSDRRLYVILSAASIIALLGFFVSPVGADRMGLYLLPLQISAFSRLPALLSGSRLATLAVMAVTAGYGMMFYVWLNFATHAGCWVPYQSVIF